MIETEEELEIIVIELVGVSDDNGKTTQIQKRTGTTKEDR